jgi:hypothetical protein
LYTEINLTESRERREIPREFERHETDHSECMISAPTPKVLTIPTSVCVVTMTTSNPLTRVPGNSVTHRQVRENLFPFSWPVRAGGYLPRGLRKSIRLTTAWMPHRSSLPATVHFISRTNYQSFPLPSPHYKLYYPENNAGTLHYRSQLSFMW